MVQRPVVPWKLSISDTNTMSGHYRKNPCEHGSPPANITTGKKYDIDECLGVHVDIPGWAEGQIHYL